MKKTIHIFFALLFFLVPLILWPYTSELFEFNKMVVTYILTTLIAGAWIIRSVSEKRIIFRRTILDIPLLFFLGSQTISTLLSIDSLTSWFGYYSRFNGGLLSSICYSVLYWALVSNLGKKDSLKLINYSLLPGAFLVSAYGVLEHFGIDKNIWQQDVQSRIFSTLGQPNWLAAWLAGLVPITWALATELKIKEKKFWLYFFLSTLFFIALLFTKSRSGLIGFTTALLIFWGWTLVSNIRKNFKYFLIFNISYLIFGLIIGTQFTPDIFSLIKNQTQTETKNSAFSGTVLEAGGTESGVIRKIVWDGAIEIWKDYPIFGTGVETFAYSYYSYRPVAHNLTSEWDYIYNKAHNEYFNFLANTGIFGIICYLIMIGFVLFQFIKKKTAFNFALLAGYVSILVTNFFGFSVVPVQILFYLYPGLSVISVVTKITTKEYESSSNLTPNQKLLNWVIVFCAGCLIFVICRYWYADYLYAKGLNLNRVNRYDLSPKYLNEAIKLQPGQSVYYSELARSYTNLALGYKEAGESTTASQLANAAIANAAKSTGLSPANVNLKRLEFGVFVMLSTIDQNYLVNAREVLLSAVNQAPTDAKLRYNLGLIYSRTGQKDMALEVLEETVDLKANYKDARLALAILLIEEGRKTEAKEQLEYILTKIDPSDSISKQYLENI